MGPQQAFRRLPVFQGVFIDLAQPGDYGKTILLFIQMLKGAEKPPRRLLMPFHFQQAVRHTHVHVRIPGENARQYQILLQCALPIALALQHLRRAKTGTVPSRVLPLHYHVHQQARAKRYQHVPI